MFEIKPLFFILAAEILILIMSALNNFKEIILKEAAARAIQKFCEKISKLSYVYPTCILHINAGDIDHR